MPNYVALKPLKWGDRTIAVGRPVPDGDRHRNYRAMLERGQIRDVDAPGAVAPGEFEALRAEVVRLTREQAAMAETVEKLSAAEAERKSGSAGVVGSNPPVPDQVEAQAGVDDLDHVGTDAPTRDDADALTEARQAEPQLNDAPVPPTADDLAKEPEKTPAPGEVEAAPVVSKTARKQK